MDQTVLDWLMEDKNPEVKLRTLKEYEHYPEDNEKVIACKKELGHRISKFTLRVKCSGQMKIKLKCG